MNVCYAYIGPLPSYSIEQVHQLRLFYNGPAYFILSDYTNPLVTILKEKYDIQIIHYNDVKHNDFNAMLERIGQKFLILHGLKERKNLFIYSFERFYILYNLMVQYSLTNVLFLEIDNLIYDEPQNWLKPLEDIDFACLFDNESRASAGVSYIKNTDALQTVLTSFNSYIETETGLLNEMSALYAFMKKEKEDKHIHVAFLPVHWEDDKYPVESFELSNVFTKSIFDAAAIGIFLGGLDTFHTGGIVKPGHKNKFSLIDYTIYKFVYIDDEKGRKIPYIQNGDTQLRINNLHIHSKDLIHHLSSPLNE
jgi:hypothetical protein